MYHFFWEKFQNCMYELLCSEDWKSPGQKSANCAFVAFWKG